MKVNLKSFSNPEYNPGAGMLSRVLWFIAGRMFINTYFPYPQFFKKMVLQLFSCKLGKGIVIKPKVNIKYPWLLRIGNNTWIGEKVWIDNLVQINIGDNCCLSQGAMLLTGNHDYKKSSFDLITGKINLEEGAWVGAQSIVCPGITMGSHSVLAVNSVLSKNSEDFGIYQGNPAVKVKERLINE